MIPHIGIVESLNLCGAGDSRMRYSAIRMLSGITLSQTSERCAFASTTRLQKNQSNGFPLNRHKAAS
jgi:hypothetical protein